MGALAAILALVAIAWALPHVYSILAKQKATQPPQEQTTTPAAAANPAPSPAQNQDSSQQAGAQTADNTQPSNPPGEPASVNAEHKTATPDQAGKSESLAQATGSGTAHRQPYSGSATPAKSEGTASPAVSGGVGAPDQAAAATSAPAGPSKQAVREVRDHLSSLQARAEAASTSLQNLRSRQQAQGVDVRSDIIAAMSRMNNDLREAQTALNEKDLETANDYLDRAGKEANTLESFLGR